MGSLPSCQIFQTFLFCHAALPCSLESDGPGRTATSACFAVALRRHARLTCLAARDMPYNSSTVRTTLLWKYFEFDTGCNGVFVLRMFTKPEFIRWRASRAVQLESFTIDKLGEEKRTGGEKCFIFLLLLLFYNIISTLYSISKQQQGATSSVIQQIASFCCTVN